MAFSRRPEVSTTFDLKLADTAAEAISFITALSLLSVIGESANSD